MMKRLLSTAILVVTGLVLALGLASCKSTAQTAGAAAARTGVTAAQTGARATVRGAQVAGSAAAGAASEVLDRGRVRE